MWTQRVQCVDTIYYVLSIITSVIASCIGLPNECDLERHTTTPFHIHTQTQNLTFILLLDFP